MEEKMLIQKLDNYTTKRDSYFTEYTFSGLKSNVNNMIKYITKEYHPAGYGTKVINETNLKDGKILVIISRANSCN